MDRVLALTTAAICIACATPAQAAITLLKADLSGDNEVPPIVSPGSGTGWITFDDVADTLRVQADFTGLTAGVTAAHIHCCAPLGTSVGVATAVPTFPGFPSGVTSGTYDQTFSLTDAAFYNPNFVTAHGGTIASARADFLAGLLGEQSYLNIHTTAFPGGEIRGQLEVVPEPATWAMMIIGFGLVGGAMRGYRGTRSAVSFG